MRLLLCLAATLALCGLSVADGPSYRKDVRVRIADVDVDLFDRNVKDVFVFWGAPYRETATPAAPPPAGGLTAAQRAVLAADERDVPGPPADGMAALAAELAPSCYACHSGPRPKGALRLFRSETALSDGVDWEEVRKRVTATDQTVMPPAPRARLAAGAITLIEGLAKVRRRP